MVISRCVAGLFQFKSQSARENMDEKMKGKLSSAGDLLL